MQDRKALSTYSDKRTGVLGGLSVATGIVAVLALGFGWLTGGAYTTALPRPFDSQRWKAADTWTETRCSMIADLTQRIGVVDKSRAELIALLGKAEDEDADPTTSHWHLCPSFMDVYILEVRWRGDRAVTAKVRDT